MPKRIVYFIALFLIAFVLAARAQDETPITVTVQNRSGDLPFSTSVGTDTEHVDVASGNLIVHISPASVKGRGMDFNFGLNYDGRYWITGIRQAPGHPAQQLWNIGIGNYLPDATTGLGWQPAQGRLTWVNSRSSCGLSGTAQQNFSDRAIYHDEQGGNHPLAILSASGLCDDTGGWQVDSVEGPDWSGAGLYARLSGPNGIYEANGTQIPSGGIGGPPPLGNGPYLGEQSILGTFMDANGNTLQQYPGGLDTLGRAIVTQQNGTGQILYKIYDSSGTQQTYTLNYGAIALNTSFNVTSGFGAVQEYVGSRNAITSIVLPNGHSYSFQYESGSFGGLTRIDLPTGAYVTYTWGTAVGLGDSSFRYVTSRTVHTGGQSFTWNISVSCPHTNTPGFNCTTTVTDPLNQQSVYNTTNGAITTAKIYSGSAVGTPLRQYDILYNVYSDPYGIQEAFLQLPARVTTTLENNLVTKKEFDYDTFNYSWPECSDQASGTSGCAVDPNTGLVFMTSKSTTRGNVVEMREFDWGQGAPGPLTRRTKNAYLHDSNANYLTYNIVNRILTQTVCNGTVGCAGNGDQAAQTQYEYDNYVAGDNPLQSTSNAAEHDYTGHSNTFTLRGNLTRVKRWRNTDGALLTTTYAYDDLGNIRAIKDPLSHTTSFDYTDSFANTFCPPPAGKTAQAYVSQVTNALSQHIQVVRFPCTGLVQAHKDQNDINASRAGTTYVYDLLGRLTQKNAPDGGQSNMSYNDVPPVSITSSSKITSSLNLASTIIKDGLARTTQTQLTSDPQGTDLTDTTYDLLSRPSTVSNVYRSTSDPTYGITTTQYDALSRVTKVIPPDGSATSDNLTTTYSGNCTTVTDQSGKSRKSCVDGLARLTQVFEDPAGQNLETDYTYDTLGNLLTVNQKGGSTNSANWRTRTFTYNSLSQLTQAINPESGTISYTYDANGNLLTKTSPAPNQTGTATVTTCFGIWTGTTCDGTGYDALNRLTKKSFSDGTTPTVKYGYDAVAPTGCTLPTLTINNGIGKRTGMCDAAGSEAWSYDITTNVGWKITDARITNGVTKTSFVQNNFSGPEASLTYPSGRTITYTLASSGTNTAARLASAVDTANSINYATAALYSPAGALSSLTNGASVVSTLYYNTRLQPCRISVKSSGTAPTSCTDMATGNILDFSYNFSVGTADNGNVTAITNNRDTTRSQNFTYDSLNRLFTAYTSSTFATSPAHCWGEQFGYDPWGNMLNITASSSVYTGCIQEAPSNLANTKNQLVGYCYDAAGNLILNATCPAGSFTPAYTYNAENQLIATAGMTYLYDGDGKRLEKVVSGTPTKMYWYGMGGDPLDETDASGNTNNASFNEYVFFNGKRIARRDSSNNVDYYFADHLGTSRIVANSSGTPLDDSDFYPFGGERAIASSSGNTYKFTGKERDSESGLDNFGKRYDSSSLGRWMSPDPINLTSARLVNPGNTLNKYVYGANNPLKYIDRDGEDITVFYRPSGAGATNFGHLFIGAFNQKTGQVGFLDYYPKSGTDSLGRGPGTFNNGNMQDRAAQADQFATLTIRTSPEEAQKVLNLIDKLKSGSTQDYAALSNNCTTVCEDVLHDLGLDFGDITPDQYWADLYRSFSQDVQDNPFKAFPFAQVPRQTGRDYGNPRNYGINFTQLLFVLYQYQNQPLPKATVCTDDHLGNKSCSSQ